MTNIKLPPLPPLHIVPSVEPVDYSEVAQALMDYAREAVLSDRNGRELARHMPCGCILCICEDEKQCQGCGAKHCGSCW